MRAVPLGLIWTGQPAIPAVHNDHPENLVAEPTAFAPANSRQNAGHSSFVLPIRSRSIGRLCQSSARQQYGSTLLDLVASSSQRTTKRMATFGHGPNSKDIKAVSHWLKKTCRQKRHRLGCKLAAELHLSPTAFGGVCKKGSPLQSKLLISLASLTHGKNSIRFYLTSQETSLVDDHIKHGLILRCQHPSNITI